MIAIVGMAVRAPGCLDLSSYWDALRRGEVLIRPLTEAERRDDPFDDDAHRGAYVPVGGFLEDVAGVDLELFPMTPREAALTDPQHRLFLELCWEALEDAGWAPERRGTAVGVFGGCGESGYYHQHVLPSNLFGSPVEARIRNDKDFLTTWVSYQLGLTGPSVAVQTACSTSLVAVDAAIKSLLAGECDVALAGGVTIRVPQHAGYRAIDGGIESTSGRCLPFDAEADGIVGGSGGGVVALRRLDDALADHDDVYCHIRGSAVGNDGREKVGFTAPSVSGQRRTLAEALRQAGLVPGAVTYLEAHATGTPIGDPIELAAIKDVYGADDRACELGSVKGNVGHLDAGAGVASLIKAALAIRHRYVPGNPWLRSINPECALDGTRFRVSQEGRRWDADDRTGLCAGVSSFGIGGTNAHVVLQAAAPAPSDPEEDRRAVPITLSGATASAVVRTAAELARDLARSPERSLRDIATQLCLGRRAHGFRWSCSADTPPGLIEALEGCRGAEVAATEGTPRCAFLFPGQLTEFAGMSSELYDAWPAYREALDARLEPAPAAVRGYLLGAETVADRATAQPALVTMEVALSDALMGLGIAPAGIGGHSLGEFSAAVVAGVWRWDEALEALATRGALMDSMPAGAMTALFAPAETVSALVDGLAEVAVAAVNTDRETVVSGASEAIRAVEARAAEAGISARTVAVGPAFHSPLTESILPAFQEAVGEGGRGTAAVPMYSSVTARRLDGAPEPGHWTTQIRAPVNFAGMVRTMLGELGDVICIEVGPGRVLTTLARLAAGSGGRGRFLAPLAAPGQHWSSTLRARGRCWEAGFDVDWTQTLAGRPSRNAARLPGYPFERSRHWIEPSVAAVEPRADAAASASPERVPQPRVAEAVRATFVAAFGHDAIADDDDFFALGGNSLIAASLIDDLGTRLGCEVPMSLLFDVPTVGGLVEALSPRAGDRP